MEGLTLVARAHGARKDWQAVVGVLVAAEEACSSAAAAAAAAYDHGGGDATGVAKHPPAELYEVVARSLALAGKWEEAAGTVRRLEVCGWVCRAAVAAAAFFSFCSARGFLGSRFALAARFELRSCWSTLRQVALLCVMLFSRWMPRTASVGRIG